MRCALACIGMLALSVPSLASRPLPVMQPGRVAYVDEMSLDVPDGVSWLRVYKEFAPPSIRLQWDGVHVTLLIEESACSACKTLDEHRAFALRVREVKATERGAPLVVLGASTAVSTWSATEQRFDDRDRLREVVVRHLLLPILASGRAYIAEIVDATDAPAVEKVNTLLAALAGASVSVVESCARDAQTGLLAPEAAAPIQIRWLAWSADPRQRRFRVHAPRVRLEQLARALDLVVVGEPTGDALAVHAEDITLDTLIARLVASRPKRLRRGDADLSANPARPTIEVVRPSAGQTKTLTVRTGDARTAAALMPLLCAQLRDGSVTRARDELAIVDGDADAIAAVMQRAMPYAQAAPTLPALYCRNEDTAHTPVPAVSWDTGVSVGTTVTRIGARAGLDTVVDIAAPRGRLIDLLSLLAARTGAIDVIGWHRQDRDVDVEWSGVSVREVLARARANVTVHREAGVSPWVSLGSNTFDPLPMTIRVLPTTRARVGPHGFSALCKQLRAQEEAFAIGNAVLVNATRDRLNELEAATTASAATEE